MNLGVVEFDDGRHRVGNIDYGTLGDLQVDLLQLVRMPTWITLYGTKKVSARRTNKIRFSKDKANHKPCVMLLFLLVLWGYEISRVEFL